MACNKAVNSRNRRTRNGDCIVDEWSAHCFLLLVLLVAMTAPSAMYAQFCPCPSPIIVENFLERHPFFYGRRHENGATFESR